MITRHSILYIQPLHSTRASHASCHTPFKIQSIVRVSIGVGFLFLLRGPNTLFLASASSLGLLGATVLLSTVLAFLTLLASGSGAVSQTVLQ